MCTINLGLAGFSVDAAFQLHTAVFVGPEEEAESVKLAIFKHSVPFRPNIVITKSERSLAPSELGAYVDEQIGFLKPLKAFTHIGREPIQCRSGIDGILQHHSFDNEGGLHIEQLQLYVTAGDQAIIVTASHLAGKPFKKYEDTFKDTLLSLTNIDNVVDQA